MPVSGKKRPVQVFYDGACPLCRREAAHYMARDRQHRIEWVDISLPTFQASEFGLDPDRLQQVMHARFADGRVVTQLAAFCAIWEALPPGLVTTPLRWMLRIPGLLALGNIFYRIFARNRYRLTGRCVAESCAVEVRSQK